MIAFNMICETYDTVVIGSGPAGLTAGIYLARSQYTVCLLGGTLPLGQLMNTTEVENYPGFPNGILGPQLMQNMQQQYENLGSTFKMLQAERVEYKNQRFNVYTNGGQYTCKALIIATGSEPRWLGIESATQFKGRGISTCATCDAFFYKKKDVVVVGGGDTALEEAIYLSGIASKVYLVHRRDKFRASQAMQNKLVLRNNIKIIFNHTVDEFIGQNNKLTRIVIKNTIDHATQNIDIDGAFIAIGHSPQSELFTNIVNIDKDKYITSTKVPGLFICGDVADHRYRQAITAAGKGCEAALDAIRFLDTI